MSLICVTLLYRDPRRALDFLTEAFGFERHRVVTSPDADRRADAGTIQHAELRYGDSYVMFGGDGAKQGPLAIAPGSGSAYVVVSDPDALHDRAEAAGAEIVQGPTDQDYGSRDFAARDPEGNLWFFGTYDPRAS